MKKLLYIFLLIALTVNAQQLAFPSALGAGAYATGGRGGIVVHVTNLNDSGTGSLRSALVDFQNQDRTIVFDVSGVITLSSDIVISSPEQGGSATGGITLAGQTAPTGGITITGGKIRMFGVDNVIARYLKFVETTATDGCFSNTDGNNVIIDHLTASHTPDICFSITSNSEISTNKTIQYCLMAQSKNGLIIGDTTPQGDVDYGEISVLRNAYYNVGWRIPMKMGAAIKVDAINNIAHNWSARLIRADDWDFTLNHIGNYYQGGLNTTNVLKHCAWQNNPDGNPFIYNSNNYMDPAETTPDYLTDESVVWTEYQNNFVPLPPEIFVDTQFPLKGNDNYQIYDSDSLKTKVLPYVGAYKYLDDNGYVVEESDSLRTAFINGIDIDDNSTRVTSTKPPLNQTQVTRPVSFDTDNDGMADAWEVREFGDLTQTASADFDSDGWTNIEEYINQVDFDVVNPPVVNVTGIQGLPATLNLTIGQSYDLNHQIVPYNATDKSVVYSRSVADFATVDQNGLVTATKEGTVTITATTNDGAFTDSTIVTVSASNGNGNGGNKAKRLKLILISN